VPIITGQTDYVEWGFAAARRYVVAGQGFVDANDLV
jgi:hypothetical protein